MRKENRCQERIEYREDQIAFFAPGAVFGEVGV